MSHDPERTSIDSLNIPIPHDIIQHIHDLYHGKISNQEAHEAARNLISFCKILIEADGDNKKSGSHLLKR